MQWKARYVDQSAQVAKRIRKAGWDALRRLGFMVRATAKEEIEDIPGPSTPPEPPHTHARALSKKGKPRKEGRLPASILYATNQEHGLPSVIIGPSANVVGTVGKVLEEGGTRFDDVYEPRPFMGPALAADVAALPGLLSEEYGKV